MVPGGAYGSYAPDFVNKTYFEVIGTLQAGNTIQEMRSINMGENFDMGNYGEMVGLTRQFPDIF